MLCTFKNFIIKCLFWFVMKLILAVLISFNCSSFNKSSPSNSAIALLKEVLFELNISYTVFISLCYSPSKTAIRRRWEGVSLTWQSGVTSKSVLLLWLFSIQCPDFSLIIFEAPFLEVYLRCNAHCFSSYFNIVHTMFLCSIFLVPSSLPFAESFFLFSVFISDDEIMEVGFRVCAFFAAIFACLSTVSFSTIPLWAGQYINLIDLMDIYEVVLFLGSLCHDSFCDFALWYEGLNCCLAVNKMLFSLAYIIPILIACSSPW